MRGVLRILYESTPAEFVSGYGLSESVARLRAATQRSAFAMLGETTAVGRVSEGSVSLQRVVPMVRNSFKPFFIGRFEQRQGVTILRGRFTMHSFVKIFLSVWLGFVTLVLLGFVLSFVRGTSNLHGPAVIVPFAMLGGGLGLVAFGKWLARNDAAWLSVVIARALGTPGFSSPPATAERQGAEDMPPALKAVALFLAGSAALGLAVGALARALPHAVSAHARLPSTLWPWNAIAALAALILAMGVWRRQRWAWWGGFGLLAASLVGPVAILPAAMPWTAPPLMRWAFAIAACLVTGLWGHWWYGQRKQFLPR
jgi:hypothetical protein